MVVECRRGLGGMGLPGESACRGTPVLVDQHVRWVRKWVVNGFLMKLNSYCGRNSGSRMGWMFFFSPPTQALPWQWKHGVLTARPVGCPWMGWRWWPEIVVMTQLWVWAAGPEWKWWPWVLRKSRNGRGQDVGHFYSFFHWLIRSTNTHWAQSTRQACSGSVGAQVLRKKGALLQGWSWMPAYPAPLWAWRLQTWEFFVQAVRHTSPWFLEQKPVVSRSQDQWACLKVQPAWKFRSRDS